MSSNLINSIDSEFPNLELLDLSHNELTDLNETSLKSIQKIFLSGNPLKCGCNLNFLKSAPNGKIADFNEIFCSDVFSPKNLKWNLAEIPAEKLLCEYEEFCTETCNCCEFKFCHCNNVCPAGCRCFRDARFQSNIVQCSRQRNDPERFDPQRYGPATNGPETNGPERNGPDTNDPQNLDPERNGQGTNGPQNLDPERNDPEISGEEIFGKIPEYATKLYLDGLKIPVLKAEFLLGRYQLKELYLNSSGILELESGALNSLTNLEILDLSENSLTILESSQFNRLPNLAVLKLQKNRLTRVESGIFKVFFEIFF